MPDRTLPPRGPVSAFLAEDHASLDGLLARAARDPRAVDLEPYGELRARLLRHIAIEEKILFPAIRAARGGEQHPDWVRLRIDHGAITSLLVPPPTPELVREIRSILGPHNGIEEAAGGVYDGADRLLGREAAAVVQRMRDYPPVKVAPYRDGPRVLHRAEDALRVSAMQFDPK